MTASQFVLEHWKDYGAYMQRKEHLVEVGTTLYLAFVSVLLSRPANFWHEWRGYVGSAWVLLALAAVVVLVWWFVSVQMGLWTSGALMCNSCQTLMTVWLKKEPDPDSDELRPVESVDFARVKLPKALVDEMERRRAAYRNCGLPMKAAALAKFELIVYSLLSLWTAALIVKIWNVWCHAAPA